MDKHREMLRQTHSLKVVGRKCGQLYRMESHIAEHEKQPCEAGTVGFIIITLHRRKLWPIEFEDLPMVTEFYTKCQTLSPVCLILNHLSLKKKILMVYLEIRIMRVMFLSRTLYFVLHR